MIYLDAAATTLQKPTAVASASAYAVNHMATPGRGGHQPAMLAAETAFACRQAAAELFHVGEPDNVVLTFNATHGLNIAIQSLVKPGDTVLISGYEHNAVTRPLAAIPNVKVKVAASPLFQPETILYQFQRLLTPEVSAVVCNHVSNVFGYVLPVAEISALCARRGVPLILDASQSAGCLPVHLDELGAAFIAMPGHKGLYGPQGTGLLLCNHETAPILRGGTGSVSIRQDMPDFLPTGWRRGPRTSPAWPDCWRACVSYAARGRRRSWTTSAGWPPEPRSSSLLCRGFGSMPPGACSASRASSPSRWKGWTARRWGRPWAAWGLPSGQDSTAPRWRTALPGPSRRGPCGPASPPSTTAKRPTSSRRLWRGLENSSPIVRRTALRRAPSRVHFLLFSSEFKGKLMGRRIAISH